MFIGNLYIKNKVFMAPMAGISNPSYMKILEEMGCDCAISELISSEAIIRDNKKTFDMLNGINDLNMKVGIQIFGSNPKVMASAAKILTEKYDVDFIDINMGCPVPKVAIHSNAGSGLLKDIPKIREIVSAVVNAVNVPVTVKIRSGWDSDSINAVSVAKAIEESGASAISIHPRTRVQLYSGLSDWNIIKAVKESVNIPVIGNGDVKSCYDALRMLDETKCDAVMIGRGLLGNPWLIKECNEFLDFGKVPGCVLLKDKVNMIRKHLGLLVKYRGEKCALLEIRSHISWYLKGEIDSKDVKEKICKAESIEEVLKIIDFYEQNHKKCGIIFEGGRNMKILCVNAGSSSLKFQLYEMPEEKVLISGYIEKIGMPDCFWNVKVNGEKIKSERFLKNHTEAVEVLIDELFKNNVVESLDEIKGVGHRVLHGGEKYSDSVVITDEVVKDIEDLTKLGPLHHPGNLAGINAMRSALPNVVNVAVFDTAFHQTMPMENFLYPVPYEWYTKYGVRKYGFHGTSHKYITTEMKKRLGKENVNLIICHVGSGASIACVKDGKCFDTTMGLTPLDGLMMGTRSGSIDPSIIKFVMQETGKSIDEVTDDLNKNSGFLGVSGFADCRDVENRAKEGNENALLALNMYANRIAKYIVDYYLELNGKVDSIVFTAGVLENGSLMRRMVIERLSVLGITLDEELNDKIAGFKDLHEGIISDGDSKINVMVLPTNEEIMIVKDTFNKVIG